MPSITIDGFTWHQQYKDDGCLGGSWTLDGQQIIALGARWVLKRYYGAVEGSRFTGWRLVSGAWLGPPHDSLEAAASYAAVRLRKIAEQRLQETNARAVALRRMIGTEF